MSFDLCCLFMDDPAFFRTITAKVLSVLGRDEQLRKLSGTGWRAIPDCWRGREMTVDIEAKAKEMAVIRLMDDLEKGDKL